MKNTNELHNVESFCPVNSKLGAWRAGATKSRRFLRGDEGDTIQLKTENMRAFNDNASICEYLLENYFMLVNREYRRAQKEDGISLQEWVAETVRNATSRQKDTWR